MARIAAVEGVKQILKNLRKVSADKQAALERGLVKAGLTLQRASQKVVPVDTGALKNSAYTRKQGSGAKVSVIVGYTQSYAIYVHENLESRHNKGKIAK